LFHRYKLKEQMIFFVSYKKPSRFKERDFVWITRY
jgi:hypothetical protein